MEIDHKSLLENLIHELTIINSMIKRSAEVLSKSTQGKMNIPAITHHSEVVLENSYLFSTQLDIISYELNPKYIEEVENFGKRNLYGKFYKAIVFFKRIAKDKDVEINVSGSIQTLIESKPVIDTLPILILDNAVKYSPKGGEIEIDFYEDEDTVQVSISNMGPYIRQDERVKIFERGFKSAEALKTKLPGLGLGLNFLKFICYIHQATINVTCSDRTVKLGDVNYSEFKLSIIFPKQMKI